MKAAEWKFVRCIDAKEIGIPIVEGRVYKVDREFSEVPEWGGPPIPGYHLVGIGGRFRQDRFVVVP